MERLVDMYINKKIRTEEDIIKLKIEKIKTIEEVSKERHHMLKAYKDSDHGNGKCEDFREIADILLEKLFKECAEYGELAAEDIFNDELNNEPKFYHHTIRRIKVDNTYKFQAFCNGYIYSGYYDSIEDLLKEYPKLERVQVYY